MINNIKSIIKIMKCMQRTSYIYIYIYIYIPILGGLSAFGRSAPLRWCVWDVCSMHLYHSSYLLFIYFIMLILNLIHFISPLLFWFMIDLLALSFDYFYLSFDIVLLLVYFILNIFQHNKTLENYLRLASQTVMLMEG